MARATTRYVCQSCGAVSPKWAGRCDACSAWNAIVEEAAETPRHAGSLGAVNRKGAALELAGLDDQTEPPARLTTTLAELDRVSGGGYVPGTAFLIGGDPGIGKSTLLLQMSAGIARSGQTTVYVSGEEAVDQIRLRARRLGLGDAPVRLAAATNLRDILTTLDAEPAQVLVIDSIQTLWSDALEAAPGTVSQVRACAQELIRFAKRRGLALFLVGHVTKDGQIAGPRVLEHMVDTVLYFEGERTHHFRILRAIKNRFGPTDEIGVFEMTDRGLSDVDNPSALFLSAREDNVAGAAVFAGIEGSRPVMVEIQALVAPTPFGTPRRSVVGWDGGRLAMVLAVLEARCGLSFATFDVYLNVAGGLRISEPAADLAVAAALVSSHLNISLTGDAVVFGEISLSGAVRPVSQTEARLKEAEKLGFRRAILANPAKGRAARATIASALELETVDLLGGLVDHIKGA